MQSKEGAHAAILDGCCNARLQMRETTEVQQHNIGVPQQGGGVPEQCDRLIGGSRTTTFQVMSAISQSCQTNMNALSGEAALFRPSY